MTSLILPLIRFYQRFLSSGRSCRYQPTCSEYAYQAVSRYGIIRGGWMALKRLSRCHPWHEGGWDPLPE